MVLMHPILLIVYFMIALIGVIYFLVKLIRKTNHIISGKKQPKSWFGQELDRSKGN